VIDTTLEEATIHDETRRLLRDRLRIMPVFGDDAARTYRLRSLLEELDVRCDETAELQDLDAVLISSARGAEALIASRLDAQQRYVAYARLIARMLVEEVHAPLDAKMEYAHEDGAPSKREREDERMVLALAQAIMDGRLDAAPRPLYEPVPKLTFAFTPRSITRSTLGGFHWWSGFWYRRSNMYRRWRSRRDVTSAIGRVCVALDPLTGWFAPGH
jgi:hypothetical protein